MDETFFWLVRHAPVAGAAGVIHAHDAPANLGDHDRLEALRRLLPANASRLCSPARRTVETARALSDAPWLEEARFREQDFGAWTGRRHADLSSELGAAYDDFWRAPATNRPPHGESFADQIARVASGLAAIKGGHVCMVVHSGTIRAILSIALDLSPEAALRFVIDPLSLTRLDRLGDRWRIISVNSDARS
jgi:alpha-ribazole phosphatase